ncbi:unnamed protein product [Enterobius vermicularis]|uniref:deoxyribose-phosphate aldolase n=1 Tax=Enterobius vermicularis TaxID=51028 RepID=A0A0N4V538_ENTVE|nr:unnamed protein product [Enterobius vermicularis]
MTFDQAAFEREVGSQKFEKQALDEAIEKIRRKAKELLSDKSVLVKLIQHIDLTTLAGDDTRKRVEELVDKALHPYPADPKVKCAAVCVYPARVTDVKNYMNTKAEKVRIASVAAGFPSGQYRLESRLLEIKLAVEDGADEIDIVINRAAALEQNWKLVHDEIAEMKKTCGAAHMKTILATGELQNNENIYKASYTGILAGSDFIKTSTGKEAVNANLEVAYVMCTAIKRYYDATGKRIGFKPAGGLKTAEDALGFWVLVETMLGKEWLVPELFRFGASSLLNNILKVL